MKESVILKLIEVVSRKGVTDKNDFYKYRLPQIAAMSDEIPFAIGFSSSASHFLVLDEVKMRRDLVASEVERFRFMENPFADVKSFIHFTNWEARKSIWKNGAVIPSDVVLFYDGDEITELSEEDKIEFPDKLRKIWKRLTDMVAFFVLEKYPMEMPYYGTKIPVIFANKAIFKSFLRCARMANGSKLLDVVKCFRQWPRRTVDEVIIIGYDFAPNSFSFVQRMSNQPRMNGGIIYDERDEDWSMHT